MFLMMDQNMIKQAVDFQKTFWNSACNAVTLACERAEKMTEMLMSQSAWITDKWKESMGDFQKVYQENCENLKKTFEENFQKMEKRFKTPS